MKNLFRWVAFISLTVSCHIN